MHRSILLLTLAAVAFGATNLDNAALNAKNILNPNAIATHDLNTESLHLFDRKPCEVHLVRRLNVLAQANAHSQERKVIDVKLRRRDGNNVHTDAKIELNRRLLKVGEEQERRLINVQLRRRHVKVDVNAKVHQSHSVVEQEQGQHKLIDVKLLRRNDKDIHANAKVGFNRRGMLQEHKPIEVRLLRRQIGDGLGQGLAAPAAQLTQISQSLNQIQGLGIVPQGNNLVPQGGDSLLQQASVAGQQPQFANLIPQDLGQVPQAVPAVPVAAVTDDAAQAVEQKRKRSAIAVHITPRNSDDDNADSDEGNDYEDDDESEYMVETEDTMETQGTANKHEAGTQAQAQAPTAEKKQGDEAKKKHSTASTVQSTAGLSLIGAAASVLFLWA
ncbi:hypothetical protein BG004_005077 [Podila humilis]|nr:hypothetical protein BG004_005077 [Podila humilis]